MKKIILIIALLIGFLSHSQNPARFKDGIDTEFIRFGEKTTAQRDALVIPSGKVALLYNITTAQWEYWDGDSWEAFGGAGGIDDQTAAEVPITDTGAYYTGTEVETALQEIGASFAGLTTPTLNQVLTSGNTSTLGVTLNGASSFLFINNSTHEILSDAGLFVTDKASNNFIALNGDNFQFSHNASGFSYTLDFTTPTATRTINFPNASGTIALEVDPSGFNGNLTTTDNTLQEIAQKFDDFTGGGSATNLTTTHNATDVVVNSDTGTDATINLANGTTAGVSENNVTDAEKTKLDGIEALADVTDATNVDAAGAVMESDYNANTILAATSDNTPVTLTVGEQTFVGRVTGGNITALTQTQAHTLLNDRILENATVTTTQTLDYAAYEIFNFTVTGDVTFSESNLPTSGSYGKIIVLNITGNHALTYPAGWSTNITGTYDGTANNVIVVWYIKTGTYKVQITQPD